MKKIAIIFFALATLVQFSACGYRVVSKNSLPFTRIHLIGVENHTYEPGLKRAFIDTFTETCLRDGITLSHDGVSINVKLMSYNLVTRSLKNSLSSEYSVVVKANIEITYPDGRKKVLNKLTSEFDESFVAGQSVEEINSQREGVLKQALSNLSKRIINEIIYNGTEKAE
jgi:hypothetical protein